MACHALLTSAWRRWRLPKCAGRASWLAAHTERPIAAVIEEVLKQRILGVKNEKGAYVTPAFPKLVYVLEERNAKPDSPYWHLTELAARCTAKRMVPDYISELPRSHSRRGS